MAHQFPKEPDRDGLPQPVAERLLARASELDAALTARTRLADLRAAAMEAGISTTAFDAALAELQASEQVPEVSRPRRRWRPLALLAACFALMAGAAFMALGRSVVATNVSLVDAAITLKCLSADEAVRLVRPYLSLPANMVRIDRGSPVLTLRATLPQLRQIETAIEQYDGNGSPACAARATGPRI